MGFEVAIVAPAAFGQAVLECGPGKLTTEGPQPIEMFVLHWGRWRLDGRAKRRRGPISYGLVGQKVDKTSAHGLNHGKPEKPRPAQNAVTIFTRNKSDNGQTPNPSDKKDACVRVF